MFPSDFTQRLEETLGKQAADQILASMSAPNAVGLWENPLRTGSSWPGLPALCESQGLGSAQSVSASLPGCFRIDKPDRDALMRTEWVNTGAVYPMNPSSLFAAKALAVKPGDEVLDLAAAPGGKSLVLAAALTEGGEFSGRLALVEPIRARFHRLRANMQRCGVIQADYYQRDGRTVGQAVPDRFDRVLLDAPCSSEARFRSTESSSMAHWSLRKVRDCARKQKALLKSAFRTLKPGGTLVYSTCSFSLEENERIVDGLLRREPAAELLPIEIAADLSDVFYPAITEVGATDRRGGAMRKSKALNCALARRVLPNELWDGFFMAKIMKRPD